MNVIRGHNVPCAYTEAFWKMRVWSRAEHSRNGEVLTCPDPVLLEIVDPTERVLFDPQRNANPFFHLAEFVWMMAGDNKVEFPAYFNKRMNTYASPDGTVHGAYGHRWRRHFEIDQIHAVVNLLNEDPNTRRAVLGMWDPMVDNDHFPDLPCNTHIYFRSFLGRLDMTVCNRSNDLVWGMLGANAVHMTFLHELIASATNFGVGTYRVFTNNLHIYKELPNFDELYWRTTTAYDPYRTGRVASLPLLIGDETLQDFLQDCETLAVGMSHNLRTNWAKNVAFHVIEAWRARKEGDMEMCIYHTNKIYASDWKLACLEWLERKELARDKPEEAQ